MDATQTTTTIGLAICFRSRSICGCATTKSRRPTISIACTHAMSAANGHAQPTQQVAYANVDDDDDDEDLDLRRLASTRSLDPEQPVPDEPPRPPSRVDEDNAPPPAEEVTPLRLGAHYAVLILAAMLGTLIRLGLDALGACELDGVDGIPADIQTTAPPSFLSRGRKGWDVGSWVLHWRGRTRLCGCE